MKKKELSCCGYDEVEAKSKPKTTSPIYGIRAKPVGISQVKADGPMKTRRISFMGSQAYPVRNLT